MDKAKDRPDAGLRSLDHCMSNVRERPGTTSDSARQAQASAMALSLPRIAAAYRAMGDSLRCMAARYPPIQRA
jgi:hypothetical protein